MEVKGPLDQDNNLLYKPVTSVDLHSFSIGPVLPGPEIHTQLSSALICSGSEQHMNSFHPFAIHLIPFYLYKNIFLLFLAQVTA